MKTFALLALCLAAASAGPAFATPLEHYAAKKANLVGESRLTWLVWDVYDAALYTSGARFNPSTPFMLELTYLRPLDGASVANKTIEEMQRFGHRNATQTARWKTLMTRWFADIDRNTKLAAMRNTDGSTTFIRDGKTVLGTVAEPEFGRLFFDIWLSERTLRPDLRAELLGLSKRSM